MNRLISRPNVSYTHDLLGNRLTETGASYSWDATNRLLSRTAGSTTYDYTYRADGLRTKSTKTVGSTVTRTEYLYDGQMPVIERDYNGSGNLSQTRVNVLGARGIEGIIVVPASGSASLKWLMVDGHGNMVRTIDTGFTLSAYQWRGVWGERQTGTLQTGRGYCANLGHQEDETGLVYMRARYYEPSTGRFITEDPARDGVNWYLYAEGNAVNRVDFTGCSGRPDTKLGGGWEIRIDGHLGDPTADMHIWYNGKEIGSIWNSGTWKHFYHDLSQNKARDLIEKLKAHSSKRVRGWAKVLGRAGYCSVVLYFEHDPLDFIAIMFDIRGDHETAALIDQINRML